MTDHDTASHLVVLTTLANADAARSLVHRLVTDRLVACGTMLDGARSIYEWEGNVEETDEVLVVLKTRRDRWDRLVHVIRDVHPYDVPELLALPVDAGLDAYLDWVTAQTREVST
jgi:periplasmic divalent cation tolerance protein